MNSQMPGFSQTQGGSGVKNMALPSLGNLGAKFSEMSFRHFKSYFINWLLLSSEIILKHLIPIILLFVQCSISKMHGP